MNTAVGLAQYVLNEDHTGAVDLVTEGLPLGDQTDDATGLDTGGFGLVEVTHKALDKVGDLEHGLEVFTHIL